MNDREPADAVLAALGVCSAGRRAPVLEWENEEKGIEWNRADTMDTDWDACQGTGGRE